MPHYWRLSQFYLFYFASLGALIPYWSLYLESQGFTPRQIGELMAVLMATKIVAPNVWGWIADHTGRGMGVVRVGSLLALVAFAGVFLATGFWQMAAAMLIFSFFWNAILPQFEAVTLEHLGNAHHRYSIIRLWGSLGFIVTVVGVGFLLDFLPVELLPMILAALMGGIWISSLQVEDGRRDPHHSQGPNLRSVLTRPTVVVLLTCCFLMQASHGPYYTFYTLYLEQHGYSGSLIGQLWALGVLAEVAVFLIMHRLVSRFGLENLLVASLLLAAVRWVMIGSWPDQMVLVLAAQLLHAASFGVFHASAVALVHRLFPSRHQGKGQALYSSLSFGAGGAVGSLYSGYLWERWNLETSFFLAAGIAFLGAILAGMGLNARTKSGRNAGFRP